MSTYACLQPSVKQEVQMPMHNNLRQNSEHMLQNKISITDGSNLVSNLWCVILSAYHVHRAIHKFILLQVTWFIEQRNLFWKVKMCYSCSTTLYIIEHLI